MNLYEIATEFNALEQMIYNDQGEVTESHEELIAYVENLIATKTDSYVEFVQKLEGEIELAQDRIAKMQAFKKVRENAIERLKKYAYDALDKSKKQSYKGNFGSISIRKPSKVLDLYDEKVIPEDFCYYEKIIDKTKLKNALKDEEISGARLVDGKKSVMIKLKGV